VVTWTFMEAQCILSSLKVPNESTLGGYVVCFCLGRRLGNYTTPLCFRVSNESLYAHAQASCGRPPTRRTSKQKCQLVPMGKSMLVLGWSKNQWAPIGPENPVVGRPPKKKSTQTDTPPCPCLFWSGARTNGCRLDKKTLW
jgi:hypothetical protein